MIRLLIIAGLIYFLYRKYQAWSKSISGKDIDADALEDVMVQDPHCKTYFPRREGIPLRMNGEELLFCSRKCRDEFAASHSKTSTGG